MGGNNNEDNRKVLLCEWIVKGEIASPNWPRFPAKIADFGLNYRMPEENTKPATSGRSPYTKPHSSSYKKWGPVISLP